MHRAFNGTKNIELIDTVSELRCLSSANRWEERRDYPMTSKTWVGTFGGLWSTDAVSGEFPQALGDRSRSKAPRTDATPHNRRMIGRC
jgi:hypothetical protein